MEKSGFDGVSKTQNDISYDILTVNRFENAVKLNSDAAKAVTVKNKKYCRKWLEAYTIDNTLKPPSNLLGIYKVSGGKMSRVSTAEAGCLAVCVKASYDYIDITDVQAVRAFLDEAQTLSGENPGDIMLSGPETRNEKIFWSSNIISEFKERYNTDLLSKLGLLFLDAKGSARFRGRYYSVINDLISNNFFGTLNAYCKKNGTLLAGSMQHAKGLLGEVLPTCMNSVYYKFFDVHCTDLTSSLRPAMHSFKTLESIKAQQGLSFNVLVFPPDDLTMNDMCFFVESILFAGFDTIDSPSALKFGGVSASVESLNRKLSYLQNHAQNFKALVQCGNDTTDVLLLRPVLSAWSAFNPLNIAAFAEIQSAFDQLEFELKSSGVSYHIADEREFNTSAKVSGNSIIMGHCYKNIIFPKAHNITAITAEILEKFVQNGGKLFYNEETPHLIDGLIVDAAQKLFSKAIKLTQRNIYKLKSSGDLSFNSDAIICKKMALSSGQNLYLVANTSSENMTVEFSGANTHTLGMIDIGNRSQTQFPVPKTKSRRFKSDSFKLEFTPNRVLAFKSDKRGAYSAKLNLKNINLESEFKIKSISDNAALLNVSDGSQLTYTFNCGFDLKNARIGVIHPENYSISVNKKLVKTKFNGTYPMSQYETADISAMIKEGLNTVTLTPINDDLIKNQDLTDPICVIGQFAVKLPQNDSPNDNCVTLLPTPDTIKSSKITDNGFPFFAGEITLSQTVNIEKQNGTEYMVSFKDMSCPCLCVRVNNFDAGFPTLAPYCTQVTDFITSGDNEIEITISSDGGNIGFTVHESAKNFISLIDVTKTYQHGSLGATALESISLLIDSGEFVVIEGADGAGKTTLLNLLAGFDTADNGQIFIDGKDLKDCSKECISEYRKNDIGFVFEECALFDSLTVAENIDLAARVSHAPFKTSATLDAVGLSDCANCFPHELTSVQKQCALIARALAKNPKIIICDEPTRKLDYMTARAVLQLLHSTCRLTGKTTIIATHNTFISCMADRIIKLSDGKIIQNSVNPEPTPAERIEW